MTRALFNSLRRTLAARSPHVTANACCSIPIPHRADNLPQTSPFLVADIPSEEAVVAVAKRAILVRRVSPRR